MPEIYVDAVRAVASVLLVACGLFVTVLNWSYLTVTCLTKRYMSLIPLFGGLFGFFGIYIAPLDGLEKYLWVPLVLDPGCLPVMALSILALPFYRK